MFLLRTGTGSRWLPGEIVEMSGPVSFHVELEDGRRRRCHQDHLRPRVVEDGGPEMSQLSSEDSFPMPSPSIPQETSSDTQALQDNGPQVPQQSNRSANPAPPSSPQSAAAETATHRYPRRNRKTTERFETGNALTLFVYASYVFDLLCMHICLSYVLFVCTL